MNIKIFDLSNLEDLDSDIKEQLLIKKSYHKHNILKLFKLKDTLTSDEIIVGYYRKYGKKIKRSYVNNLLNRLKKAKVLKRHIGIKNTYSLK